MSRLSPYKATDEIGLFQGLSDQELSFRFMARKMDTLIETNIDEMLGYVIPTLYSSGITYEHTITEGDERYDANWKDCIQCIVTKKANCKSLVAYRIAELRLNGFKASYSLIQKINDDEDQTQDWHVQVRHADGTLEDPSALLGMYNDGEAQ
jgi:hypothetical protein